MIPLLWASVALAAPSDAWEDTLERVAPAVVSIQVMATRDFDTENAGTSQGTGFVVDAERGLILTNRHMVHAGPVVARATFIDSEEVDLAPVYRDPVHDFGLYRFDPAALEHLDLVELDLAPDAAKVGMEIRVVGNDAGEKLSILDGTLARLDRNAPFYGRNTYNDFNTFYFQAASNTSGGSSGSPVIDVEGRVVALNAGGSTRAASSFYLPLNRVERALERIRSDTPVPRGTLGVTFRHQSYVELGRIGLDDATEDEVREAFPDGTGMLVVHDVLDGGPAWEALQPGDVLVRVDGRLVTGFLPLEARLDDGVGDTITLELRRLGRTVTVSLDVADLHAITPSSYLELSRGILHDLSYQQARNHDLPLGGVYVAASGHALGAGGIGAGNLITHVDGQPVASLDEVQAVLAAKPDRSRVRVRFAGVSDVRRAREAVFSMDRTWFPMRRCTRDDALGWWPCQTVSVPSAELARQEPAVPLPPSGDRWARRFGTAFVLVDFDVPYSTGGVAGQSFLGTGVVVDAEQGLVVVDRDTVPVALGDLELTFGGTLKVPGEVLWLHPHHNVGVVRYDPALLGDAEVAEVRFDERWLDAGDAVRLVGLDRDGRVVSDALGVDDVQGVFIPPSRTPRFRDTNVELITLQRAERTVGGLVLRGRRPVALWASTLYPESKDRYFYGLPGAYIAPVVEALREGREPEVRRTGFEVVRVPLSEARERGLPDDEVAAYVAHDPERLQLLEVRRLAGGTPAASLLRQADLIVRADGRPVSRARDVEAWTRTEAIDLVVLRDGALVEVRVPTTPTDARGIRDAITWAGVLVHEPHAEVATLHDEAPTGVYVAWYWYGSPAHRDGLRPTRRIVAIDGEPVDDLDDFAARAAAMTADRPVVLTLEDLEGRVDVLALELDPHDWPTERITWRDGRWQRTRVWPEEAP